MWPCALWRQYWGSSVVVRAEQRISAQRLVPTMQGAVWSCVLNEEAVVAATASADFSTRLWNALTGDEVHQFQHSHIARTVAFARRSPRLLSAGAATCLLLLSVLH